MFLYICFKGRNINGNRLIILSVYDIYDVYYSLEIY